jgi:ribosomal protein S18 acetylase RimI-like enzyme
VLFATGSVARRIELAEGELAAAFANQARAWRDDVLVAPIGGTQAVFGGPGEPFNKLAGLGFGGPIEERALAEIEREFDARQAPLQVELAALADNGIAPMLARRGYDLVNFENVLGVRLAGERLEQWSRTAADTPEIAVERSGSDEARTWVDVTITGFEAPDTFDGPASHERFSREALERVYSGLADVPGFRRYLARRAGVVSGSGAIRIFDGLAQFCGAATLPAHRRRGVQSALLRARLLDAAHAGCDLAVVTTQPGSKSQENVQRAGFELLYTRAILVRACRSQGS